MRPPKGLEETYWGPRAWVWIRNVMVESGKWSIDKLCHERQFRAHPSRKGRKIAFTGPLPFSYCSSGDYGPCHFCLTQFCESTIVSAVHRDRAEA